MPATASKVGVLFVSDQPDRLRALRQSALAGREVFLWTGDHKRTPDWSVPLRGDPAQPGSLDVAVKYFKLE